MLMRSGLIAFSATLILSGQVLADGKGYPDRPVRIVVPYSAGGLADNLARAIANDLGQRWKQPLLVENRAGANTIVAAREVKDARPDGYTILFANTATLSSNQYLFSDLPYDPVKDFVPVVNVAETANILVARQDFPANTIAELVQYAKSNPEKVTYGSFGAGSNPHLDTEAFSKAASVKMTHVPYKGVSDVNNALLGGHTDIALVGISATVPLIRDNRIKALALFAPTRSPLFPDVPTLAEAGVPDVESRSWFGFVVPDGTPDAVIQKIANDTNEILADPVFVEKYLTSFGLQAVKQGPEAFQKYLEQERAQFSKKIKESGIKID